MCAYIYRSFYRYIPACHRKRRPILRIDGDISGLGFHYRRVNRTASYVNYVCIMLYNTSVSGYSIIVAQTIITLLRESRLLCYDIGI